MKGSKLASQTVAIEQITPLLGKEVEHVQRVARRKGVEDLPVVSVTIARWLQLWRSLVAKFELNLDVWIGLWGEAKKEDG